MSRSGAAILAAACCLLPCACAATPLPPDVSVRIYQTRSDVPAGKIEIAVTNRSGSDITIHHAELHSPVLDGTARWERPLVIPSGLTTDLKVTLPPVRCPPPERTDPTVTIAFSAPGHEGTASVTPADTLDQLRRISGDGCLRDSLTSVVSVTPAPTLGLPPEPGGIASLTVTANPTGGDGAATITAIRPTALLKLVDDDGRPIDEVVVGETLSGGSGPIVIPIRFVPMRCDAHALAEDKRGTFFPFSVVTPVGSGLVEIGVPDSLRGEIYQYVADYCRLHGDPTDQSG